MSMCIAHFYTIKNMNFSENLKTFRLQFGYTQTQIGDKIGIRPSNISDWENGKSRPEYENLIKLADIFDVTLDELLGRKA